MAMETVGICIGVWGRVASSKCASQPYDYLGMVPGRGNSKGEGQGGGVYLPCLESRRTSVATMGREEMGRIEMRSGGQAIVKTSLLNELGKH